MEDEKEKLARLEDFLKEYEVNVAQACSLGSAPAETKSELEHNIHFLSKKLELDRRRLRFGLLRYFSSRYSFLEDEYC